MTEAEWLKSSVPKTMFGFAHPKLSERKLRLFGCACCRRVWKILPDDRCRNAVDIAERFADGDATRDELDAASARAQAAMQRHGTYDRNSEQRHYRGTWACFRITSSNRRDFDHIWTDTGDAAIAHGGRWHDELEAACHFLRDLLGNPFRPLPVVDPVWLTETVRGVAAAIYADHTFGNLPVLADALQDAGCEDAEILAHLRGPGPHVRGCWALDLTLGKT